MPVLPGEEHARYFGRKSNFAVWEHTSEPRKGTLHLDDIAAPELEHPSMSSWLSALGDVTTLGDFSLEKSLQEAKDAMARAAREGEATMAAAREAAEESAKALSIAAQHQADLLKAQASTLESSLLFPGDEMELPDPRKKTSQTPRAMATPRIETELSSEANNWSDLSTPSNRGMPRDAGMTSRDAGMTTVARSGKPQRSMADLRAAEKRCEVLEDECLKLRTAVLSCLPAQPGLESLTSDALAVQLRALHAAAPPHAVVAAALVPDLEIDFLHAQVAQLRSQVAQLEAQLRHAEERVQQPAASAGVERVRALDTARVPLMTSVDLSIASIIRCARSKRRSKRPRLVP